VIVQSGLKMDYINRANNELGFFLKLGWDQSLHRFGRKKLVRLKLGAKKPQAVLLLMVAPSVELLVSATRIK
jgi:hypothetical protein